MNTLKHQSKAGCFGLSKTSDLTKNVKDSELMPSRIFSDVIGSVKVFKNKTKQEQNKINFKQYSIQKTISFYLL